MTIYKFTDEQWDEAKAILVNQLIKINKPEYEWDFDTFYDASEAFEQCFVVDDYFQAENIVDERSIPAIVSEIISRFCDTSDMGEYIERQAELTSLLLTTFEQVLNPIPIITTHFLNS